MAEDNAPQISEAPGQLTRPLRIVVGLAPIGILLLLVKGPWSVPNWAVILFALAHTVTHAFVSAYGPTPANRTIRSHTQVVSFIGIVGYLSAFTFFWLALGKGLGDFAYSRMLPFGVFVPKAIATALFICAQLAFQAIYRRIHPDHACLTLSPEEFERLTEPSDADMKWVFLIGFPLLPSVVALWFCPENVVRVLGWSAAIGYPIISFVIGLRWHVIDLEIRYVFRLLAWIAPIATFIAFLDGSKFLMALRAGGLVASVVVLPAFAGRVIARTRETPSSAT